MLSMSLLGAGVTMLGLSAGGREQAPIAAIFLRVFGGAGLVLLCVLWWLVCIGILELIRPRKNPLDRTGIVMAGLYFAVPRAAVLGLLVNMFADLFAIALRASAVPFAPLILFVAWLYLVTRVTFYIRISRKVAGSTYRHATDN